jgi:hypothetical protein
VSAEKADLTDRRRGSPAKTPDAIIHEIRSPALVPKRLWQNVRRLSSPEVFDLTRGSARARNLVATGRTGASNAFGEAGSSISWPSMYR